MPLTGDDKWLARIRRAANVSRAADEWAMEAAELVAAEARRLVDEGGYTAPHIPSSPGQAPNSDTGNLVANTNAEKLPAVGQAVVISHATSDSGYSYSLGLEFGNSRIYERPFMRPATANKRQHAVTLARNAVDKLNRNG